jgi:hypothetical protein
MLRALGLPAVLGATGVLAAAAPGTLAIIDGGGRDHPQPHGRQPGAARAKLAARPARAARLARLQRPRGTTLTASPIDLQANLELPFELPMIAESGAHGIGLMRSEFIFMNRESLPDEDTQTEIYRDIVEAMDGDPVTIRVLDWGSDKEVEALSAYCPTRRGQPRARPARHPPAAPPPGFAGNPARGHPARRRRRPGAHHAADGRLSIAEIIAAWEILRPCLAPAETPQRAPAEIPAAARHHDRNPAAALAARHLAKHADFFAIGTNDLTMYTLAADRGLPVGSKLYDPLEPTMLRLIHATAKCAARRENPGLALRRTGQPPGSRAAAARPRHPPALHARQRHPPRQTRHPCRDAQPLRVHGRRSSGCAERRCGAQYHSGKLINAKTRMVRLPEF